MEDARRGGEVEDGGRGGEVKDAGRGGDVEAAGRLPAAAVGGQQGSQAGPATGCTGRH